ncbi:hypothetical protein BGX23_003526 [Mortierella sp. AD031]|nr:hypothetical protein BGX23_003526 [Mortierella sp. AD031]
MSGPPPRQPRPHQPLNTTVTTSTGGTRNATTTDPASASGPEGLGPRRRLLFQRDQDSGSDVADTNNPFAARRREGRPEQRHVTNSNSNNSLQSRSSTATRLPGGVGEGATLSLPPAPRAAPARLSGAPPPTPRPAHAVARPTHSIPELRMDDPFARRAAAATARATPRGVEPRLSRQDRYHNFDSPELNASPITPWDAMFSPNTQVIETAAGSGTPLGTRPSGGFPSIDIAVDPERRPLQDSDEGPSGVGASTTAAFIKRPSRMAFQDEDEEGGDDGDDEEMDGGESHLRDKVVDDDDVDSFFTKRERNLVRDRRAIEKQPRRLSSHTGPHDMFYSSLSATGMATPDAFSTPQFRTLAQPPTQPPTRTHMADPSRGFDPMLLNRNDSETPVGRNRDQADEVSSLWTNAGRRAIMELKSREYGGDHDGGTPGAHGGMSRSTDTLHYRVIASEQPADTPMGSNRLLPSSLSRGPAPERDPFLETPGVPMRGRSTGLQFNNQDAGQEQEQLQRQLDFDDGDIVDLDQEYESAAAADTAFIMPSVDDDSIAELIYNPEDLEEERRRKRSEAKAALIRANRSFELGLKAAREEAEAEAARVAQGLLGGGSGGDVEVVEMVEESEDTILKRRLLAEMERDLESYEESSFEELPESILHLPPTDTLINGKKRTLDYL